MDFAHASGCAVDITQCSQSAWDLVPSLRCADEITPHLHQREDVTAPSGPPRGSAHKDLDWLSDIFSGFPGLPPELFFTHQDLHTRGGLGSVMEC